MGVRRLLPSGEIGSMSYFWIFYLLQVKLEQRRALTALKEKELINVEHQKAILAKSKLESLCRELQKHSKMIKDEAMKRAQIEESKRKEVADSFQSTIDEV